MGVVSNVAGRTKSGLSSGLAASHLQDGKDHLLNRRTSEEENNESQKQKVLLLYTLVALL